LNTVFPVEPWQWLLVEGFQAHNCKSKLAKIDQQKDTEAAMSQISWFPVQISTKKYRSISN